MHIRYIWAELCTRPPKKIPGQLIEKNPLAAKERQGDGPWQMGLFRNAPGGKNQDNDQEIDEIIVHGDRFWACRK